MAPYRAYDPKIGKWLSQDPIEHDGGLNLYGNAVSGPVDGVRGAVYNATGISDAADLSKIGIEVGGGALGTNLGINNHIQQIQDALEAGK